jgi:hypothetical protein
MLQYKLDTLLQSYVLLIHFFISHILLLYVIIKLLKIWLDKT